MHKNTLFDIIIIGGGLSGGLAAAALAEAGFTIAVVDREDPKTLENSAFDGRTTAISYASARVFRRLGLWEHIEPGAAAIRDILVTDGRADGRLRKGTVSPLSLHFDGRELGEDHPLGWIVENTALRQHLASRIGDHPAIELFAPKSWSDISFDKDAVRLTLDDGTIVQAALVIGADGRFSALRAAAKIKTNQWRYKQHGIVAVIAHERDHEGVAQELFLPAGPFAILPMTPHPDPDRAAPYRSSIVWTERAAATPGFLAMSDADFSRSAAKRFGPYLGSVEVAGPRWSYPLAFTLAQSYVAPRLALIGDAAHAIHPIAGQGYNLAVKDIAALSEVISDARDVGLDIGAMTTLVNYQRWRRFDSASLALGTDLLNKLFSNDIAPIRLARDIGLGLVGQTSILRKTFMRQAGADLGTLPRLMARET